MHGVTNKKMWKERLEKRYWQFDKTDKWFSTFRLNILTINGDNEGLMQMAELEIFGDLRTAVKDAIESAVVNGFQLEQNYPNPFNPLTRIQFSLPKSTQVTLTVYSTLGQKVKTLLDGHMPAGTHYAQWDGTDENEATVANSVYFYLLQSDLGVIKKKMMFLK